MKMNIYNNYPDFASFIKNEVDTLAYLNSHAILKDYRELEDNIYQTRAKYASLLKKSQLNYFNFHAKFIMEVERHMHYVVVGANVTNNFQECTYFLAMTDKTDEKKLIRKFHFDYADKSNATNQSVPSFHLQYGGRMSPQMKSDEFDDAKLDHWLSLPRLNFSPINLALLLDIMFCEFRTTETTKIVESSEWRSLIFENEKFLSSNYFKNISKYIDSAAYSQSRLLRDFCYGS